MDHWWISFLHLFRSDSVNSHLIDACVRCLAQRTLPGDKLLGSQKDDCWVTVICTSLPLASSSSHTGRAGQCCDAVLFTRLKLRERAMVVLHSPDHLRSAQQRMHARTSVAPTLSCILLQCPTHSARSDDWGIESFVG